MNDEGDIVQYLKEIGGSELLTKEQEVDFFKQLHNLAETIWDFIITLCYEEQEIYKHLNNSFNEKRVLRKYSSFFKEINKDIITIKYLKTVFKDKKIKYCKKTFEKIFNYEENILLADFLKKEKIKNPDEIYKHINNFLRDSFFEQFNEILAYDFFIEFRNLISVNLIIKKDRIDEFIENLQKLDKLRNYFAEANLKLVVTIAKNYLKSNIPWADAIQEGNLGLLKAIERFDYKTGNRFSTYAIWWIKQSIVRAIIEKGSAIRIPLHLIDCYNKIRKMIIDFNNEHNSFPDIDEISSKTMIEKDKVNKIMEHLNLKVVSLDEPISKNDESAVLYEDIVEDTLNIDPLKRLEREFIVDFIKENMDKLTEMQQKVLKLRYGFDDGVMMTLEQIGVKFGLSRERIRQIQEKALLKLRGFIHKSSKILQDD